MRLRRWILLASTTVGLCLAVPAHAAGTLDKIKASQERLHSVIARHRSRFSYTGDDNQPWGYSVDLCTRVAAAIVKQLGLEELQLQWVASHPGKRVSPNSSPARSISNAVRRPARWRACRKSTSACRPSSMAPRTCHAGPRASSASTTWPARKIAVAAGTTTERIIAQVLASSTNWMPQLVKVSDHQQGIAAMLREQVDAYASDRSLLIGLALDSGSQNDWAIGPETFSYEPYALMMRRNDADFRLAVNRELARLSRSREIYGIYDRWFGFLAKPGPRLESMYQLNALPE
jgi:glutamate/aspartate transport system substrate-binding protein